MQVVVYGKLFKEKDLFYIQTLFDALHEEGITTFVYAPYHYVIKERVKFKSEVGIFESYLDFKTRRFDYVITLGGDGTILNAVTEIRDSNVPILGINLGRLGFLASIEKAKIKEAILLLKKGMYSILMSGLCFIWSPTFLFLMKFLSDSMIVLYLSEILLRWLRFIPISTELI